MIDRNSPLWNYLGTHQRELIEDGEVLFKKTESEGEILHDYGYLIFPYAKTYEGFLKKLFFDLGFIDERTYLGDRFRIGKGLNPSLERRFRHESIYDKLVAYCGGKELADELWQVWKQGRNLLFHYFPHNLHKLTFLEAKAIRDEMVNVMEKALSECKMGEEVVHIGYAE